MARPAVSGEAVMSPIMLIGQAPGPHEGALGRPFAWTAGKTLFSWFEQIGMTEAEFRTRVYMAAVCRCFPGKAASGGDRVPSGDEIDRCRRHMTREISLLRPQLIIPVGKLAIEQMVPELDKLTDVIGSQRRVTFEGWTGDMIALPHPSGASTWHRTEPGKTLLVRALSLIAQHDAWQAMVDPSPGDREQAHAATMHA
jgi:uracil-DNA glycosylase